MNMNLIFKFYFLFNIIVGVFSEPTFFGCNWTANPGYTFSCNDGSVCGDGIWNSNLEQCDDSNNDNGDGCSSTCEIEQLSKCVNNYVPTSLCSAFNPEDVESGLQITSVSSSSVTINSTLHVDEVFHSVYEKIAQFLRVELGDWAEGVSDHYKFSDLKGQCNSSEVLTGFAIASRCGVTQCTNAQDATAALKLVMLCAPLKSNTIVENGTWIANGTGSPLALNSDFAKVGGECGTNKVASGIRFQRGGCNQDLDWTDGVVDPTECAFPNDENEGLTMELLCHDLTTNYEITSERWVATGTAGGFPAHHYFDRLGGFCNSQDEVATGFRFQMTGIGGFWWDKGLDVGTVPTHRTDTNTGLLMYVKCAKVSPTTEEPKILQLFGFYRNNMTGEHTEVVVSDDSPYLLNCFKNSLNCEYNTSFLNEVTATHFGYYLFARSSERSQLFKTQEMEYSSIVRSESSTSSSTESSTSSSTESSTSTSSESETESVPTTTAISDSVTNSTSVLYSTNVSSVNTDDSVPSMSTTGSSASKASGEDTAVTTSRFGLPDDLLNQCLQNSCSIVNVSNIITLTFNQSLLFDNIYLPRNVDIFVLGDLTVKNFTIEIGTDYTPRVSVGKCFDATNSNLNLEITSNLAEGNTKVVIVKSTCITGSVSDISIQPAFTASKDICITSEDTSKERQVEILLTFKKNPCGDGISDASNLLSVINVFIICFFLVLII